MSLATEITALETQLDAIRASILDCLTMQEWREGGSERLHARLDHLNKMQTDVTAQLQALNMASSGNRRSLAARGTR